MTRNFAITLERMHVSKVDARTRHLYRRQKNCARPDCINIHMAIGSKFQLLRCNGVFVRSANQRGAEIASIMGIRHSDCRRRSELAKERPQSSGDADQIMRSKRENRMLSRAVRQRSKLIGRMRNSFWSLFWNRDSYLPSVIKNNGVSVNHLKGSD